MPTLEELFDEFGPQQGPLSAAKRRTLRQQSQIGRGIHPATEMALANNGQTCGTCKHCEGFRHGGKSTYYKCLLMPVTNGPGSDIRLSWPACVKWVSA